ncbi:ATP-dependent RNA helicase DHX29-like isoform X1 [Hibiscus syriacus]|uniref:ATP-dependent RNA helicase DHX29-like isoform X1 n=1 Tax=Hibiscus syriacus TaxID=106335 RepID=A0A6A3A6K3_HIBSY|nr:WEB family protein At1g75720-like [Hibiscus syriacus]KAE8698822.1 ATP-dependent RNA helicase DHX29-like isoform X1 [Hibiscus syriacus]
METQVQVPATKPPKDYRSNVDTSRPFRTVKEAVAVFGERLLVGEIYTPKPYTYSRPPSQEITWFSPGTPLSRKDDQRENNTHHREVLDTLKKLETELEETKAELKLLKERESETEIALASLNAELHKNMSKLAIAEAAAAKKAAETTPMPRTVSLEMGKGEDIAREEAKRKELMKRMENNPTLSQILSIGEKEGYFAGKRERKLMKKKPIVPLVGDWIFKKKGSHTTLQNPLYAS